MSNETAVAEEPQEKTEVDIYKDAINKIFNVEDIARKDLYTLILTLAADVSQLKETVKGLKEKDND